MGRWFESSWGRPPRQIGAYFSRLEKVPRTRLLTWTTPADASETSLNYPWLTREPARDEDHAAIRNKPAITRMSRANPTNTAPF